MTDDVAGALADLERVEGVEERLSLVGEAASPRE
jgi:hypothetical protein